MAPHRRRRPRPQPPQPGQSRLRLLHRVGVVDPESLDDYRAHGGYEALRRAIDIGPDGVLREMLDSKLMGRGGAAFPTGRKWDAVARQPRRPHYLVCNADESEPGTFKDRVIMESDPFSLIESMTIAALRHRLRARLPLPAWRVPACPAPPRERPRAGAGARPRSATTSSATACGSTSSCAREPAPTSAGRRRPSSGRSRATAASRATSRRSRPSAGCSEQPTVVNNVETLVNVLPIVLEGGPAFASIGTERSTGPKLFCVSGAVVEPGTYEVPFGTTLRELLELAGGIPAGRDPADRPPGRRGRQLRHPRPPGPEAHVRGCAGGPHDTGIRRCARTRRHG